MDFFCEARGRTAEAIRSRLASPVFVEAIGVLEMISKTPEQRRYYQARLKWELDENSRRLAEAAAREESEARGMAEGLSQANIKQVRMLQGLLQLSQSDIETLQQLSVEQLESIIENLQAQLRERLS
jgi:hypothetical protein